MVGRYGGRLVPAMVAAVVDMVDMVAACHIQYSELVIVCLHRD